MKILEDTGFCTCCGHYGEYKYGDENYSLLTKDLKNYQNYKDYYVYMCPSCGFICDDISGEEGVVYGDIKNTQEFKDILDYKYLNGLDKELYDCHSQSVPANLYEAYSLVCFKAEDEEKYIRVLNKSIELKVIMARKYRRSQDELGGEEENDDEYYKLDDLIKENVKQNREKLCAYFEKSSVKNVFLLLIYIENLIKLERVEEAKKLFDSLTKKTKLCSDLENYFNGLIG